MTSATGVARSALAEPPKIQGIMRPTPRRIVPSTAAGHSPQFGGYSQYNKRLHSPPHPYRAAQ